MFEERMHGSAVAIDAPSGVVIDRLWAELTGNCQLECVH